MYRSGKKCEADVSFTQRDDEFTLLLKAQKGDKNSLDALFSSYSKLINQTARSYYIAGGDRDDIMQEAMIGFYKAIRDYRADKNTSFKAFAELCMTRQILTAIKAALRLKHLPLNSYVPFDRDDLKDMLPKKDRTSGLDYEGDPQYLFVEREAGEAAQKELYDLLSDLEKRVFDRYFLGESYEEIADSLEITTKSVDNAVQRIKRKFLRFQNGKKSV